MKNVQLSFNANAKLEKLVGRELITNNIIAIFELIKNSYDAFANKAEIYFSDFDISLKDLNKKSKMGEVISSDKSKIIIKDDGKGMSFSDVKLKWMEIGTTSKEQIQREDRNGDSRVINGEKGIGRFGTDKLGSVLELESIREDGLERTLLKIDWNKFDDHAKRIQDIKFECYVEELQTPIQSGVTLTISKLRDQWTLQDIVRLKRNLCKLVSPFSQEQDKFKIYLKYNEKEKEQIINDSFDFATMGIEAKLSENGMFHYTIFSSLESIPHIMNLTPPQFGPVSLKILYMDKAAKNAFTRKTGLSTKDYGNIRVFRDNFRVLPYGEKENDWLGIDNKHAQGTFRTFGTRDLIGYVQISKIHNPILKDATSRQGLNEDIRQFEEFKEHIWLCIELLQNYVFENLKRDSEKKGIVIKEKVNEIRDDINSWEQELPEIYEKIDISDDDKNELIEMTKSKIALVKNNINSVEEANKQLFNRVKVLERIVGSENRLYAMLHAIKNRLVALEAMVIEAEMEAERKNVKYDRSFADKTIKDIENLVLSAMRRSSPKKNKRDTIILSEFIREFIEDNKRIYPDVEFRFMDNNYYRLFVNTEELRISLEDLLSNSIKAMEKKEKKIIALAIVRDNSSIRLYFEDNGIGVQPEKAPFIFNVSFTTTNGSGIGLSNVLDFMKGEGGDINLIDGGELGGALFEMIFPLKGGFRERV